MKKNLLFIFFVLFFTSFIFAESEGENLFKINKPEQAIPLLEKDISSNNISINTYNFLGLAYCQIGEYNKAVEVFEKGMNVTLSDKKVLSFNQGNAYYSMQNYSKAEKSFSLALVIANDFYPALLNRANARLMLQKYKECVEDYKNYILNVPDDEQRPEIERLILYLQEEQKRIEEEAIRLAEEQKRLEEENARMQAELERQKELQAQAEAELRAREEERRRKLLEDVANSLQQTDSVNMTAGTEDVIEYDYESELE